MVDTRTGKSTAPSEAEQARIATLLKERKEKKELLKQVKLKAIEEEPVAKKKRLEEEMLRFQKEKIMMLEREEEERRRAAEEEAVGEEEEEEEEEEPLERGHREQRSKTSGTKEEDGWREKKISEWVANLSLGEDEEAQLYVPQEEKEEFARALELIEDPLERQATEDEKKLEWKLKMMREKKRRREEASRIAGEVERTRNGHYELIVMPFALTNAPQTFQRYMNDVFRPWLDRFVVVYLDDILVFSRTLQEHQGHLRQVLEKLREANFKINAKKCEWAKTQVLYLGHVLDRDGIKPEDSKIAAIRDWPTPRTLTELRSFLGLANYYRKFVRNFSTIAAPLRKLLKKEAIWQWDKDCTSALKKLKRALIEYHVLKVADPSLPFVITTNASQYGIGAVLQQYDSNGYKPVEFMLARMPSEKVATSTYERELYALRQALEHWKHYLLGRHFKVYSDHETLKWLKTQTKMTPKLTRWAAKINQYDFELKPIKGKYNVVADALSRRSDYFGAIVHYLDIGRDLQEKVRQAYTQDPIYNDLLKKVKEAPETEPDYRTTEGLLFGKTNVVDRLCVPNSAEIRSLILGERHDTEGHFGWQKTLANLMHAYTWPGMKNDCIEYVRSCKVCQWNKTTTRAPLGLLLFQTSLEIRSPLT
ncbi:hypothetical protein CBR_g60037 [Chara braunii]|uniref:Reverse transcriptase domain-containing protein n=1 Tax=Chara braunii TaxID=69332 RepID=A0A388K8K5_CHABU|nr:hypothetical protein CBR_g60037 [Chara braunii]|eukprot:GBG66385.1 hypothetical protein CBR_g60037 [Chara braunii]